MRRGLVILIFICIFFFLFTTSIVAQCAMCKQAAESTLDSNPNSIARGLNSGILYLMAVPYLMIMFIFRKQIATLYRRWRGKEQVSE
jgi:hypothetical protein